MNPLNDMQSFINQFRQMATNPAQFVMRHYGIPQNIANDPDAIIQKMMQEGKITQEQYNRARQLAPQIQNSPLFKQLFKV